MSIENSQQLENTRRKLSLLEQMYTEAKERTDTNAHVRGHTLRSIMKRINQFKEEMIRFETHSDPPHENSDSPT